MTVAVAVALYNGEKFIVEQMETLRKQTHIPDRVVFCDDCSTDKTVDIIKNYIAEHDLSHSWMIYENKQNVGYIRNFYAAMLRCEEDVIFLCDQDDIWKLDKIEKMCLIMEERKDVALLSTKYDIIDSEGNALNNVLQEKVKEDEVLSTITVKDIMTAYRWPGMVMCIRNDLFKQVYTYIKDTEIPHDLAFAILAADNGSFYEMNYVGAFHRRHENNTAKEEHRISKRLNLERKLSDIEDTCNFLEGICCANLPISSPSKEYIDFKLEHLIQRKRELEQKSLIGIIKLYLKDPYKVLRMASFIGDIWLVLFGKTQEIKN